MKLSYIVSQTCKHWILIISIPNTTSHPFEHHNHSISNIKVQKHVQKSQVVSAFKLIQVQQKFECSEKFSPTLECSHIYRQQLTKPMIGIPVRTEHKHHCSPGGVHNHWPSEVSNKYDSTQPPESIWFKMSKCPNCKNAIQIIIKSHSVLHVTHSSVHHYKSVHSLPTWFLLRANTEQG